MVGAVMEAVELKLNERERSVLACFVQPPPSITTHPTEPGFNLQVAAHLGITKNMLDWSLHRVRQSLLEVMRAPEFAEHVGPITNGPGWPHLAHSDSWHDVPLVEQVISARGYDDEIKSEDRKQAGDAECWSVVYSWGEALFLRLGELAATIVMEGRFNHNSGTLFGAQYGSQTIPVPWYQRCMRVLRGT
jgi:hypothetical protein